MAIMTPVTQSRVTRSLVFREVYTRNPNLLCQGETGNETVFENNQFPGYLMPSWPRSLASLNFPEFDFNYKMMGWGFFYYT